MNREKAIAILREERQGVRIRHSFYGMVTAWLVGAVVISILCREKDASAWFGWVFLTGIVCLGAWLLIGLPTYWFWPRVDGWWSLPVVMSAGFLGGILPVVPHIILIPGGDWPVAAIPGAYGVICAGVARALEERFLRKLAGELTIH